MVWWFQQPDSRSPKAGLGAEPVLLSGIPPPSDGVRAARYCAPWPDVCVRIILVRSHRFDREAPWLHGTGDSLSRRWALALPRRSSRRWSGGAGPGPQEFIFLTLVFPGDSNELGALDQRRGELKWLGRHDGELRRVVRFDSPAVGNSRPVKVAGGGLAFPLFDPATRSSVAILRPDAGRWTYGGPFPEPYRQSMERGRGAFVGLMGGSLLDRLDQTAVLVGFVGVDTVYRYETRGDTAAPLGKVPRLYRRGNDGPCRFAYESSPVNPRECANPSEHFSLAVGLWVLNGAQVAIVHADRHMEGRPPAVEWTATYYLTVLDRATDSACVDIPLRGGDEALAVFDLVGDSLYVLDRHLTESSVETWLLQTRVPRVRDCPEERRVQGWLAPLARAAPEQRRSAAGPRQR